MEFKITNKSGTVIFTADIEDTEEPTSTKLGHAVKKAVDADANLSDANLADADLDGLNLAGANLWRADLRNVDLIGANLTHAYLVDANFARSNLEGAKLTHASLSGANLYRTNLGNTDLSYANLIDATLWGANLRGANFAHANFKGVKDIPNFTMPDGLRFHQYTRDVVPALLTAGGRSLDDIKQSVGWDPNNCPVGPVEYAFFVDTIDEIPLLYRARAIEFTMLFNAHMLPEPWETEGVEE